MNDERTLSRPARVGHTTFGIGVEERLVVEAAQRAFELGEKLWGWEQPALNPPPKQELLEGVIVVQFPAGPVRRRVFFEVVPDAYHQVTLSTQGLLPGDLFGRDQLLYWRRPVPIPGEETALMSKLKKALKS